MFGDYERIIESTAIITIGVAMHMSGISALEMQYSKLPVLVPNHASILFAFSLLCFLTRFRPTWTESLHGFAKIIVLLAELSLIIFIVDFALHHIWMPCLKTINYMCLLTAQYVLGANENYLLRNAPRFSMWLRDDSFCIARLLFALILFAVMLDLTGFIEYIQCKLRRRRMEALLEREIFQASEDDLWLDDMTLDMDSTTSFGAEELPYAPRSRNPNGRPLHNQARQMMLNTEIDTDDTDPILMLSDSDNECTC